MGVLEEEKVEEEGDAGGGGGVHGRNLSGFWEPGGQWKGLNVLTNTLQPNYVTAPETPALKVHQTAA